MSDITDLYERIFATIIGGVGVNVALVAVAFIGSWRLVRHQLTEQGAGLVKLDAKIDTAIEKLEEKLDTCIVRVERRIDHHNGFVERVARLEGELYGRRREDARSD